MPWTSWSTGSCQSGTYLHETTYQEVDTWNLGGPIATKRKYCRATKLSIWSTPINCYSPANHGRQRIDHPEFRWVLSIPEGSGRVGPSKACQWKDQSCAEISLSEKFRNRPIEEKSLFTARSWSVQSNSGQWGKNVEELPKQTSI